MNLRSSAESAYIRVLFFFAELKCYESSNKKTPPNTRGCRDGAGTEKRPKYLLWGDDKDQAIAFHKKLWLGMRVESSGLVLFVTNDHTHSRSRVQLFGEFRRRKTFEQIGRTPAN